MRTQIPHEVNWSLCLTSASTTCTLPRRIATSIQDVSTKFWLTKPSQPSKANVADWAENDTVNPYFWITSTNDPTEANMVEKSVKHDNITFTILVNKRGVAKFESTADA